MKIIYYILFTVLFIPALAQEKPHATKKIKTLEVSDTIAKCSVDRGGELYIITRSGQFQRFDQDGHLQVLFKTDLIPTYFDPRDGARLFAYYRDLQQYEFLSPSFQIVNGFRIDSAFVIQPWLMCTSGDTKLWVLDAADHSLKKLNPKAHEIEIEVVIDSIIIKDATGFVTMKEYQNFVFLLHPHDGIFIFNSLGQHIRTIEVKNVHNLHFLGEEMYYVKGHHLKFFDLFTAETREMTLEHIKGDIILTDQRLFAVHPKSVDIYEFKP